MKSILKSLLVGLIIIVIGVGVLLFGLYKNDWKFSGNIEFETKHFESTAENSKIDVELYFGELSIEFYDGDKILVDYPVSEKFATEVEEDEGVLYVKGPTKVHWYDYLSVIGVTFKKVPTTIKLPKDSVYALDLTVNAGEAIIGNGTYSGVDIKLNAGSFTTESIACDRFDATVNAGGLDAQSVICKGNANLKVNAGSFDVASLKSDDITVKVNAGSMNVKIDGAKADYNVSLEQNAGSVEGVSWQTVQGSDKSLNVEVNAGSANFSFTA